MILEALIVLTLATWSIVEVWHHGSLFAEHRARLEVDTHWYADLLLCPFCLSRWIAGGVSALWVLCYPWSVPDGAWLRWAWFIAVAQWLLLSFAVSGLANILNDLLHPRCRTPNRDTGE